jgi:hypothetical protein
MNDPHIVVRWIAEGIHLPFSGLAQSANAFDHV